MEGLLGAFDYEELTDAQQREIAGESRDLAAILCSRLEQSHLRSITLRRLLEARKSALECVKG